jgi:hypothetical protein
MTIRSKADVNAMAKAVSRPGIDPRIHIALAIVQEVGFDPNAGLFADIQYYTGEIDTALVGSPYTADSGGLFCPLEVGDTVLVAIPDGDSNNGPTIISQMWNPSQKPAPEMGTGDNASGNVVWRVRQGRKFQLFTNQGNVEITAEDTGAITIQATGSGTVTIQAAGTVNVEAPNVLLGPSPGQPIARVGDMVQVVVPAMVANPGATPPFLVQPIPPVVATLTQGIPAVGQIVSGQQGVKA